MARISGLPVLGSVSMIVSPDEISRNRRMALIWGGGNIALIALAVCMIAFEQQVISLLGVIKGVAVT